jgi:DNA polymerase-3 subunit gamma/tau
VIARKWRPQSFDQLIGQTHISQTLQNALKNGRLPHALLFTGPRGTGKTSSARILAKSVRCPQAVDFVPCNICSDCIDITASRSVDVIEIDGASNNGVDAIRELRDTVSYMPSSGKYKVYIIDEVHMLSTAAFNALLKTLEEPPAHVIFVMATTEVHKIPQTILSRCQRFDFRSIPTRQITERLKSICTAENVSAEDDALWIIARQGDGSMRDSQSLLDQVITFANGPLTRENVVQILGLTDRSLLLEALSSLVLRDEKCIFSVLEKVQLAGYEPTLFLNDLLENVRNLLLVKVSQGAKTPILELPESELRYLADLAAQATEEDLHLLFDMALKAAGDAKQSSEPRLVLEMGLLRMVKAPLMVDLKSLLSGQGQLIAQATAPQMTVAKKAPTPVPAAAPSPMSLSPTERWLEFVKVVRSSDALFAAKIEHLMLISFRDKHVSLGIPPKMVFLKDQFADVATRKKLQGFIDQIWGDGYTLELKMGSESVSGLSAQALKEAEKKTKESEIAQKVAEHPLVKSATAALNGQIKSIKSNQIDNK